MDVKITGIDSEPKTESLASGEVHQYEAQALR